MIPVSVLDLAVVTEGSNIRETIEKSRNLAIHVEKLGYKRFWMAEHHNMENIARSATGVLLGDLAEAADTIRIGSGGGMLPNHSPQSLAEQFGTLAELCPARVDLGLGRAPGPDQFAAAAIRPDRIQKVHNFPEEVAALQTYLSAENRHAKVRTIPGEGTDIPIWILGSSTDSAYLAASLGLPYAFASHFAPQQLSIASKIYREQFKPSKQLSEPKFMPCINVIAADTDAEPEYLSTSLLQMFMGVVTGKRSPLAPPVDDIGSRWPARIEQVVRQMPAGSFIGSPESIKKSMTAFVEQVQADELMVATYMYDHELRLKSFRLFAEMVASARE